MPVNKSLYAADWRQIRERIRERGGNRCEQCGIPNRAIGYREKDGEFVLLASDKYSCDLSVDAAVEDGYKVFEVVCTVAHLDHNPTNNDPANLAFLCQKHHLALDIEQHRRNSAATRARRRYGAQPGLTGLEMEATP